MRCGKLCDMVIIDFDDTLFNTQALKPALTAALVAIGVAPEDADWSYKAAYSTADGRYTHSHERRAEMLAQRGYDQAQALAALQAVTATPAIQQYVLPGAIELLEGLRALGQPLVLLSLGDPDFQKLKVDGAGIGNYFAQQYLVSRDKKSVIAELMKSLTPPRWLINDKVDESRDLAQAFPNLQIILKQPPHAASEVYAASGYPHFTDLKEILAYVQSHS